MLFYVEAAKYNVLPLDDSTIGRFDVSIRPSLTRGWTEFAYYGTVRRIPEGAGQYCHLPEPACIRLAQGQGTDWRGGGRTTGVRIRVTPAGLVLEEIAPGLTPEQVQSATEAKLIISPTLKEMS